MALPTNTRLALRQELLKRTDIRGFNSTTSSAGAANGSTFVDNKMPFADSTNDATMFENAYIYLLVATPEVRKIAIGGYANTGTGTLSSNATAQVANATAYEIWPHIDPTKVNDAINRALERHYYTALVPLSFVDDPDMEKSVTATDNWTLTQVGAAPAPTMQISETPTWVRGLGRYSLQVLTGATGIGSYAAPNILGRPTLPVTAGKRYWIDTLGAGWLTSDNQTAKAIRLQAYDVTGASSIATVDSTSLELMRLHMSITIPTSSTTLSIRLVNQANVATVAFGYLIVQPEDSRRLPCPSFLTNPGLLQAVYRLRDHAQNSTGNNSSLFNEWDPEPVNCDIVRDDTGPVQYWLHFNQAVGQDSYFAEVRRPYPSLDSDTATTTMDKYLLLYAAEWDIWQQLTSSDPATAAIYQGKARDAQKRYTARRAQRNYQLQPYVPGV